MDKSTVVVVRLPKPMLEAVDRLARAQYLSRSEAMRALVRSGFEASFPLAVNGERDAPQPDAEAA
jgi:metal-responsive CopG/Arc/MetJ family transcriptional regulator